VSGLSKTWWGQRFTAALEAFTDRGRLERGRPYATGGRVEGYAVEDGKVQATVRGKINPYYGVYTEPHYKTRIALKHFTEQDWTRAITQLAERADLVIKLLLNEMPDTIDEVFAGLGLHLLPTGASDFTTKCSCPDATNPCKHVAAVYYLLAADLDHDPFLLFELRGLPRSRLREELAKSPLGRVLATELVPHDAPLVPVATYFTSPGEAPAPDRIDHRTFWLGGKLPAPPAAAVPAAVPALLLKTQGDNPPFWHKDASFVETMEELYERVRTKSPNIR
jgi:uncharacterized Zn finger protein